ncbi:MAG: phosphoribosylamine--glycine ligase [Desulfovibrionaceae bacterium]|nr:phosphoribosylamine--glycine ligase [Desulfovibrionaceae bacterium]
MRIMIIGSGGREHALAWKIAQSHLAVDLRLAPGNGAVGPWVNVPLEPTDVNGLARYAREEKVDLVVPGGETTLVLGIVDACREAGVACFGPDAYAAQLEGSKLFAKEVMLEAGVPTASYRVARDYAEAREGMEAFGGRVVIKADGLASGKGVVVPEDRAGALQALDAFLCRKTLGEAGHTVLIEERLEGEEVSLLAFCDGERAVPMATAQDHKRALDGDRGPNTGGMGAYSPAPMLPETEAAKVCGLVMDPVLRVLARRGHPFKGVLYAGLMLTDRGPMVLEYNVRFGDPECQPLLMRLEGDLLDVMLACAQGRLHEASLSFSSSSALCVVVAARGYPASYPTGMGIFGIRRAEESLPGLVKVFQAGTRQQDDQTRSSGGRVLGVTALGTDLAEARKNAYGALSHIRMENSHFRRDIGDKGLRCATTIG